MSVLGKLATNQMDVLYTLSLGIFEIIGTSQQNRCIINGGHNTGGFAQSPSIAMAVIAAVKGEENAMHSAYNPNRFDKFEVEYIMYDKTLAG
ncbi:hypothetical protein [Marinomonas mediterranea]|uniref:hypothetical protein n=1 Tax=Marinomonas mediterranea TaxID=119864 RepID=UPI00234A7732|nr:hypothetical protein [Marinomonas mediterranea]WCN08719.1 hypothetical protein GV055_07125 [Marinomonas mediterranea]